MAVMGIVVFCDAEIRCFVLIKYDFYSILLRRNRMKQSKIARTGSKVSFSFLLAKQEIAVLQHLQGKILSLFTIVMLALKQKFTG